MKKVLLLLFILYMTLYAKSYSVQKGQTYYQYILKPMLGYDGAKFSKKYTKEKWERLFANEAEGFKEVFSKESKAFELFLQSEKFKTISNDLKAFAMYYAKDASVTPSCQE